MAGLILDSSTDTLILAQGRRYRTFEDAAKIGSTLFPLLEEFLEEQPTYIAAGRGPGSYTGTRAAVAAATGYAQGAEIPLILFPSLLAFLPPGERVAAVLEIKGISEYYTLIFENGKWTEVRAPLEELLPKLRSCESVASAQALPKLTCIPLRFHPEFAISRITTWVEPHLFSPISSSTELVYLHQKM